MYLLLVVVVRTIQFATGSVQVGQPWMLSRRRQSTVSTEISRRQIDNQIPQSLKIKINSIKLQPILTSTQSILNQNQ